MSEENGDLPADLARADERISKAEDWMQGIFEVLLLVVWIVVVALIFKRGQTSKLTLSIKVSFALYLLHLLMQIYIVIERLMQNYYERWWRQLARSLSYSFFAINHWIFCWHYFQAACLF